MWVYVCVCMCILTWRVSTAMFDIAINDLSINSVALLSSIYRNWRNANVKLSYRHQWPWNRFISIYKGFYRLPRWLSGKEYVCQEEDIGLIPGSGRSPGEENGKLLQYSSWKIPWTKVPGRLQSMGLQRIGVLCQTL